MLKRRTTIQWKEKSERRREEGSPKLPPRKKVTKGSQKGHKRVTKVKLIQTNKSHIYFFSQVMFHLSETKKKTVLKRNIGTTMNLKKKVNSSLLPKASTGYLSLILDIKLLKASKSLNKYVFRTNERFFNTRNKLLRVLNGGKMEEIRRDHHNFLQHWQR